MKRLFAIIFLVGSTYIAFGACGSGEARVFAHEDGDGDVHCCPDPWNINCCQTTHCDGTPVEPPIIG